MASWHKRITLILCQLYVRTMPGDVWLSTENFFEEGTRMHRGCIMGHIFKQLYSSRGLVRSNFRHDNLWLVHPSAKWFAKPELQFSFNLIIAWQGVGSIRDFCIGSSHSKCYVTALKFSGCENCYLCEVVRDVQAILRFTILLCEIYTNICIYIYFFLKWYRLLNCGLTRGNLLIYMQI